MDAFREPNPDALPTAKPFVGRAVVVQVDPLSAESTTLVEDIVFMRRLGVRPIVVHDVDQRACGSRLVGLINRIGGDALALDGTSASTLVVTTGSDGRNVVRSVNVQLLSLLLEQGYIPVFSSEGASFSGAVARLDAADAAQVLATSVHAIRLLYPSGTGGISAGSDGIIQELTSSEALTLASAGTLSPDQSHQLTAAAMGVRAGVDAAQLLDLRVAHAALVELLTARHLGTQVVSHVVLT
jgi:acetylglutamate kinase